MEFAIGTIFVLTSARLWQNAITSTIDKHFKESLVTKYLMAVMFTIFAILISWYLFAHVPNGCAPPLKT